MSSEACTAQEWPHDWLLWADGLQASKALGLRCLAIEPGRARLALTTAVLPLNPNGAVHGGLIAAVIDQALGIVAATALPDGRLAVTSSLTVDYYQPAVLPFELDARVVHAGRRQVFAQVELHDSRGQVCAAGHGSMVALRAGIGGGAGGVPEP